MGSVKKTSALKNRLKSWKLAFMDVLAKGYTNSLSETKV